MQPGGSGGAIASTPFSSAATSCAGRLVEEPHVVAGGGERRAAELARRVLDARAARTGSASRSRSASSCRRSRAAERVGRSSARSARRAARRRGTGSAATTGRASACSAGSCFFSTRIAVGELNIVVTSCSSTIFHQIAGSGRIGRPSYMIVVDAVDQRAVDDVRVPDDPADVAGREHRLAGRHAEDVAASTPRARPRSRRCRAARPSACRSCPTCRGCTRARTTRATRTAPARPCAAARSRRVVEVAAGVRACTASRPRSTMITCARRMLRQRDRLVDAAACTARPCRRACRRRR